MFDVWATGIFTIAGTLLGTLSGYLLTVQIEKSKKKQEYQILIRKIERGIVNLSDDFDSFLFSTKRIKKILTKNDLDSINYSYKNINFFNEVFEFEKLSSQLIHYTDNSSHFELLARTLSFYVRHLNSLLDLKNNINCVGQFANDLKPVFDNSMKSIEEILEKLQKEFENIK